MTEEIIQGNESPAEVADRRAAWNRRDQDTEREASSLTIEEVERLLIDLGVTRGQINQAKRDRGKPMP